MLYCNDCMINLKRSASTKVAAGFNLDDAIVIITITNDNIIIVSIIINSMIITLLLLVLP